MFVCLFCEPDPNFVMIKIIMVTYNFELLVVIVDYVILMCVFVRPNERKKESLNNNYVVKWTKKKEQKEATNNHLH